MGLINILYKKIMIKRSVLVIDGGVVVMVGEGDCWWNFKIFDFSGMFLVFFLVFFINLVFILKFDFFNNNI